MRACRIVWQAANVSRKEDPDAQSTCKICHLRGGIVLPAVGFACPRAAKAAARTSGKAVGKDDHALHAPSRRRHLLLRRLSRPAREKTKPDLYRDLHQ